MWKQAAGLLLKVSADGLHVWRCLDDSQLRCWVPWSPWAGPMKRRTAFCAVSPAVAPDYYAVFFTRGRCSWHLCAQCISKRAPKTAGPWAEWALGARWFYGQDCRECSGKEPFSAWGARSGKMPLHGTKSYPKRCVMTLSKIWVNSLYMLCPCIIILENAYFPSVSQVLEIISILAQQAPYFYTRMLFFNMKV